MKEVMASMNHPGALGMIGLGMIFLLVLFIGDSTSPTGAAAYFSEPTYCDFDPEREATILNCACGRATVRSGRIAQNIRWKGSKDVVVSGDWCRMQHQREMCMELCKYSSTYLLNSGYVRAPTSGTAEVLAVEGRERPHYGAQHQRRAWVGAYSYVSGY